MEIRSCAITSGIARYISGRWKTHVSASIVVIASCKNNNEVHIYMEVDENLERIHVLQSSKVPQTLEYRGGQLNAARVLEVENFTNWKKRFKALMNELVNDGIKFSKLEINTGFINGLPKKWLSFCQSLRNTNHVKDFKLASPFSKLKYEENLIDSIYETKKSKSLVSATPLLTTLFSTSIVQDFQDSPDDEEDTRRSHEYLKDLKEEYQEKALLAKSKRFFKKGTQRFSSGKATNQTKCHKCGNKGHFDKEEVSSYDEETKVKALMALTNEERIYVGKESARNGEWTKITMKKGIGQLTEDTSSFGSKDLVFVKSSTDNSDMSITSSNLHKSSKAKDSTLPNHNTDEVPSNKSQRNTIDPSIFVYDSPASYYDSADESLVCRTHLLPLKKLDGVEPSSGPKTVKSILKSKSTFKAKTLKGIIINEPSSAPARGNKISLGSKTNSAPAGKLKNVNVEDDPPLAVVIKELNELKLQISKKKSSYSRNKFTQQMLLGSGFLRLGMRKRFQQKELLERVSFLLGRDFTAEADHGLSTPNDSIAPQQGMDEGTKNTSYNHISAGTDPHVLADQTKSVSEGLETVLTQPTIEKGASFTAIHGDKEEASTAIHGDKEDASITIKLEDLAKLSQKHKLELEKNKAEAESALLKAQPPFLNVEQLNELLVKSLQTEFLKILSSHDFGSSLPTELKDLPSKFNELTEEIKGLKTQVHELEIGLPKELKEIPTKLEDFTKTATSLTSYVAELKTLQWELLKEFLSIPAKRKQRNEVEVSHNESEDKDHVPTPSSDPLPSETKDAQSKEIVVLKKKVSKLLKWRKSRSRGLRRLMKIGSGRRVKSPLEKDSLGAQEDASKKRRMIKEIDQDDEIALDADTQGKKNDDEMFGVDLSGEEVVLDTTTVTIIVEKVSVAPTTDVTEDEITMAQTLAALKSTKPKVVVQEQEVSTIILAVATTVTTAVPTPRAKGVIFHEQKQSHIPTISSSKDKCKAKFIEHEVPIKKKDQIKMDEEYARQLEAKEQKADSLLAERLQAREREEFSEVQKARLLVKLIEKIIDDTKELKKCMEIVPDDGDKVLIEATPISSRSPISIDYKINKEGKRTISRSLDLMHSEVFGYIILMKTKTLIKKLKDLEDEYQVYGRIVRIKGLQGVTDVQIYTMEAGATTIMTAKLPILNPEEYDLWLMRIEQYFLMIDYSLWEVIMNGNKVLTKPIGSSEQTYEPTTAEEKQDRRNEMKARGTLLMALPNKDQLKFHLYQDAKLLMEAIKKMYRGNKESKKVQRTLLKQQYENFAASSLETLDQTFDRLQKLIRSSNINQNPQNMAFVSSKSGSSTNEADTTASEVSTTHTQGTTVNSTSVDNLSDAMICAFLASQPNTPQLTKEDLEQIDPDDLEEMDLHWEMAILTIRAKRFMKRTGRSLDMNGQRIGFDKTKVECFNCHKNGHFARECRALRNQDNRGREYRRTNVPVETPTKNALIAQDEIRGYDWSYQAEEETPTNYAFMALTSSESSSSSDFEVNPQQKEYKKGVINSGCSRHMTGNKCYLTDFEAFDGGFVSFRDGKGRIFGKGIKREYSVARTPQQNEIAKKRNRTLIEAARTMALVTKPYNKIPYELIRGRPPLIDFMKPFGCPVTILNTRDNLGKFEGKANEGYFVSAEDAGKKASEVDTGKALDNGGQDNQVSRSNDGSLFQQDRQTEHNNSTNDINIVSLPVSTAGPSFVNAASQIPFNVAGPSASTNAFEEHSFERFSPFKNAFSLPYILMVTPIDDTVIFGNAYDDDVLEEEVDMYNVDSAYAIPKATKNKKDERGIMIKNKARLVAQGHTQEEGIDYDEVFAPVAWIEAIRLFLAYASFKDFVVYQMDVESAFLYRKIEEDVYVC
uniref:Retrovirus-related Pol polyprotein from transposon TNT 1-94 n=1 Tax=Tanacetum cinerariifolium TaxID=118510 RepID=A0A6L2KWX4_TANCI|nr:retrovirus-related Pol polyprotein from transposon TNT 1-94 [Tanacetum cinerariifolium]